MKKQTKIPDSEIQLKVVSKPLSSLELAKKLLKVREDIEELKEVYKATLEPLEASETALTGELVAQMKMERLSRTQTLPDGSAFTREIKTSIEVTDEAQAMEYAASVNCLRIDKTKIASLVKREVNTPAGFALKETEFVKRVQVEEAEEVGEIE